VSKEKYEIGLETRRAVLGREHVDRSLAAASPFTRPVQELVTEFCWGAVWTREGLPRKIRSLINIAMLTALNRPHELELHLRASFNNGVTVEEIQEVILQTAAYCGFPAALESSRIAEKVINARNAAQEGTA
jgi:4-carboxymuconolactone decarboxylase